jgi:uncharacterized PurR-regulated membrane protein YhhQ (DUF165 family)
MEKGQASSTMMRSHVLSTPISFFAMSHLAIIFLDPYISPRNLTSLQHSPSSYLCFFLHSRVAILVSQHIDTPVYNVFILRVQRGDPPKIYSKSDDHKYMKPENMSTET